MKKPAARKPAQPPCNPLIDPLDGLEDNIVRVRAFSAFLQTDAEQAGKAGGPLKGESLGRALAHQVLTDALEWLETAQDNREEA